MAILAVLSGFDISGELSVSPGSAIRTTRGTPNSHYPRDIADGFVAIETYGKAKQGWLETFLDLPYGIPSHDTFGRVFGMIEPQELENSFLSWISSITEKLDIKLIHVDGKTAKGSYDRAMSLDKGDILFIHPCQVTSGEQTQSPA